MCLRPIQLSPGGVPLNNNLNNYKANNANNINFCNNLNNMIQNQSNSDIKKLWS